MEEEKTYAFTTEDIEKNKVIAALAYILFFLPLLVCPDSKFGRFHANQGLLLLILSFAGNIAGWLLPVLGGFVSLIFSVLVLVLAVMGIVSALNGEAKELPVIGKYALIK
jgi:uncharacterized membrane protein